MVSDRLEAARLRIERVVAGGDALAREPGGRVVFVPGALPHELVDVRFVSAKRDFARSSLLQVVEPSAQRVEPPCPELARGCGGCDWQHAAHVEQRSLKAEIVREALSRTAKLSDASVVLGGSVSPWAYRTSMRFALDASGRPTLHMARSDATVSVDRCMIGHPTLIQMLPDIRLPGADELSLRVSVHSGELSAWWTAAGIEAASLPSGVITGERGAIVERIAGIELRVSAASFFQSGPQAAELLVQTVRDIAGEEIDRASNIVDAYGGIGLFAACAVAPGSDTEVVLVEGSPSACSDARHNLAGRNARVVEIAVEDWEPCRAQVVIADPSRRGLGAPAVERLVATNADTFVLISCDPVAFARDVTLLAPHYRLMHSVVLDLFPQTHHVEIVSRFERVADAIGGA